MAEFDLRNGDRDRDFVGRHEGLPYPWIGGGDSPEALTVKHGTAQLWQGLPVLFVV